MSIRVNDSGSYVLVPEQLGAIWVPQSGQYVQAREVWVSEEVGIGQFQYVKVWEVLPPPPDGVNVTLQQEFVSGGDMLVSWTNAANTTGLSFDIQWRRNGITQPLISGSTTGSFQSQTERIPESELFNFSQITARMRYVSNGVAGEWGDFVDPPVTYFA